MLIGLVTYAVGIMLTPGLPYFIYENDTRIPFKLQRLLWPHSVPELNPLASAGFDIVILGAAIAILAIVRTSSKCKSTKARPT
jgi:hypothetical protein